VAADCGFLFRWITVNMQSSFTLSARPGFIFVILSKHQSIKCDASAFVSLTRRRKDIRVLGLKFHTSAPNRKALWKFCSAAKLALCPQGCSWPSSHNTCKDTYEGVVRCDVIRHVAICGGVRSSGSLWIRLGVLISLKSSAYRSAFDTFHSPHSILTITLVNKDFVPWGKSSVSDKIFGRWIQICFQNFSITHTFGVVSDYVKA
jgi:hypothetical protein